MKRYLSSALIILMLLLSTAITSAASSDTWQDSARRTITSISRAATTTSFRGSAVSGRSRSYAIVVGQDAYTRRPLTTCVNDAKIMSYILKTQMKIPSGNIKLLLNRTASKYLIKELFRQISLKSRPEDFVVFYYSGHGVKLRRSDGSAVGALYLIGGYKITADELRSWISMIKGKVLLIFDSCFSGAMIRGNSSRAGTDAGNGSGDMWKSVGYSADAGVLRNVNYLASSSANQLSYTIRRAGYSRFTFYFQKAILEGASDANRDGKISLNEAFNWTRLKLIKLSRLYRKIQTPIISGLAINTIIMNKDVRTSIRVHTAPVSRAEVRRRRRRRAVPPQVERREDAGTSGSIGGTTRRRYQVYDSWEYARRVARRPRVAENRSDAWIINRHRYQGANPEDSWGMNGLGKFIN